MHRDAAPSVSTAAGAALDVLRVSKRYGPVTALSDVTLHVRPGEFLTLLGPSGCGKTTLLKTVAGFVPGVQGEVLLGGRNLMDVPPYHRDIGVVFQNYALFPHYTVSDNVAFGLRMRRLGRKETRDRVADALRLVRLEGFETRYPRQLSGGQQQRVALARVLAFNPQLLLLDEPFGALDRKLRAHMQVELKRLLKPLGITTIFVTHDQEEAMTLSDRIAVMQQGRIVQCAEPLEIYDRPANPYVADFIGVTNLMPGRLVPDGSRACVEVFGVAVGVPGPIAGGPEEPVLLAIRPENLVMAVDGPGEDGWRGRLTFSIPSGPRMDYEVTLEAGFQVRVSAGRESADAGVEPSVGSAVRVRIANVARCRVFPVEASDIPV